jgi:glycerol-3-phosphate dehydrogenase (NAD(P)+)
VAGFLDRVGGPDAAGASMHNLAAALFAQGCTEIDRLLQLTGGTRAFAHGLPGAGDFYVTCQGGRTVRLGRLLGQGYTFAEAREILAGETLEAAMIVHAMGQALPKLTARGLITPEELPLLRALVEMVVHGRAADLAVDRLLQAWTTAAPL